MFEQGGEEFRVVFTDSTTLSPDLEYYAIFEGKQERHVTKATWVNGKVIRAVVPGKTVEI